MKITLFVRNDITMPLGKICAQCAHAVNAAILQRLSSTQTETITTLTPTADVFSVLENFGNLNIQLEFGNLDFVLQSAESDEAYIQDKGLTVFNEPTITVSWKTHNWGDTVNDRLPFSSENIPFKQPIFVNRSNSLLDETSAIKSVAYTSSSLLATLVNRETKQITLSNDDPMCQWLQNGFGKTVVGCKKASNFNACISKLESEQGTNNAKVWNDEGITVLSHYPIASDDIEIYTKNKHARLLNSL